MSFKMPHGKGEKFPFKEEKSETPLKAGLLGKLMNPLSMLPGKAGEIAGKLNPLGGMFGGGQ
jgi:hypothetical protein